MARAVGAKTQFVPAGTALLKGSASRLRSCTMAVAHRFRSAHELQLLRTTSQEAHVLIQELKAAQVRNEKQPPGSIHQLAGRSSRIWQGIPMVCSVQLAHDLGVSQILRD